MSLSPERINFSRTTYESSFCPVAGNFPYGEFRFINVTILISSSHKLFFIILSRDSAIAITRLHFCRASRHSVGERERERETFTSAVSTFVLHILYHISQRGQQVFCGNKIATCFQFTKHKFRFICRNDLLRRIINIRVYVICFTILDDVLSATRSALSQ